MADHKAIALRALERCNGQLDEIFYRLEQVDEQLMNQKISNEVWSVVQIFNHLLEGEVLSLRYLKYKLSEHAQFEKETFKTKAKYSLAMIFYTFPVKFKAPKNLNNPSNDQSLEEIKQLFIDTRTEMRAFIEARDNGFFVLASSKHPLIGRITLAKMIRFFSQTHCSS